MKSVVLADGGQLIIKTAQGYQYNGLFFESLKDLDPGRYRLVEGPAVPFDDYWESGRTWAELVEARP